MFNTCPNELDDVQAAYYNLPKGYHSKDIGPWSMTLDKYTHRFATASDGPVFHLNKTLDSIYIEIPSSDHWGFYLGPNPDPIYKNPTTFNGYRIK